MGSSLLLRYCPDGHEVRWDAARSTNSLGQAPKLARRTGKAGLSKGGRPLILARTIWSMPRTRPQVLEERVATARAIGARMAAARERAGVSQTEAAVAISSPQSRIAKLELGLRQLQFLEGLRLAALYGVAPSAFDPSASKPPGVDA